MAKVPQSPVVPGVIGLAIVLVLSAVLFELFYVADLEHDLARKQEGSADVAIYRTDMRAISPPRSSSVSRQCTAGPMPATDEPGRRFPGFATRGLVIIPFRFDQRSSHEKRTPCRYSP